MKKLFWMLAVVYMALAAAGCSPQPYDVEDNPEEIINALEAGMPSALPEEKLIYLDVPGGAYSLGSENIPYAIINNTGQAISVLLIPTLERETTAGWEEIPPQDVGFCGTPDAIESRWEDSIPLSWYADTLTPGHYRLSFNTVYGENYAPKETLAAEFDLTAAVIGDAPTWISPDSAVDMADLNLYWQSDNLYFPGDENATLSIYVRADISDKDGGFVFDDGQDWLVLLETADGNYPLFPRQFLQFGIISCMAFEDLEKKEKNFHVLITVAQNMGYQIYDCIFDQERQEFKAVSVFDAPGINFITSSP